MLLLTALLAAQGLTPPAAHAQAVTTTNLGQPGPASTSSASSSPVSTSPVQDVPAVRPRPLAVGGVPAGLTTTPLPAGQEGVPLEVLPRLGVSVSALSDRLILSYRGRTLTYLFPQQAGGVGGWTSVGFAAGTLPARLPLPQGGEAGTLLPLALLRLLGVPVSVDSPEILDFTPYTPGLPSLAGVPDAAPTTISPTLPSTTLPTAPSVTPPVPAAPPFTPVGALVTLRSSRTLDRNIELQRVVLEFGAARGGAAPASLPYTLTRDRGGLSVGLPGVTSTPVSQKLPGGDTLGVAQGAAGSAVRLDTGGGRSEVFTLQNPYRIVIDTTTNIDSSVPPPVEEDALPAGVTLRRLGGLTLLTFDPARYAPRVVTAPLGSASGVAELVRRAGGVAGVNGGYFDPASSLPVDLVAQGGLMLSASLEKRATVGFDAQGAPTLGYPRPRYLVSGAAAQTGQPFTLQVNSVSARANPQWVTAFVGDGRTAVGDGSLTTLSVQGSPDAPGRVTSATTGRLVPARGTFTLTFDPDRYPQLALNQGASLSYTLNWQLRGWEDTVDALSAGPLLVRDGQVVVDGAREGFDVGGSIWRATRQVAFIQVGAQYGVAYLSSGTPDDFARALALAGVRNALRFDSGSSATVFVTGGYLDAGGYLNTVWSRPVPNALVFVARGAASR